MMFQRIHHAIFDYRGSIRTVSVLICGKACKLPEMEADHIKPWSKGGKTVEDNCQMLCKEDNRRKGSQ